MSAGTSSPFLELVRSALRVKHYSIWTERAYLGWVRRFILFHGKRHPEDMGEREVVEFLSYLAVSGKVAPGTQNQAFNALLFLYRNVLGRPLENLSGTVRGRNRKGLPRC